MNRLLMPSLAYKLDKLYSTYIALGTYLILPLMWAGWQNIYAETMAELAHKYLLSA
jgi:hypothetical protein